MKNNIQNELIEIAPTLAAMDKSNPYKVPPGYFSMLENRTLHALGVNPVLSQTPPNGYFDGLPDQILDKVAQEEKTKVIPLYRRSWMSIAASFIVIAGAIYLMNTQSNTVETKSEFAFEIEIEAEEALDYLIENGDLYLSDLLSLDPDALYLEDETSNFEMLKDKELDDFLNELDQEDLEDLL